VTHPILRVIFAASVLLAGGATASAAAPGHIDHIQIGTTDLDRGVTELTRLTGVRPKFGGTHPGAGTRNALLSLGNGTYLELYAPNPAEPVRSKNVAQLRALKKLAPVGFAITVTDAGAIRSALRKTGLTLSPPQSGARTTPDGSTLHWQAFEIAHFDDPLAPFFIRWADPALHPSRTSPDGCTLRSLILQEAYPARLRKALRNLALPVTVRHAATSAIRVRLSCPAGEVILG